MRALERSPDARFATAADMLAALERAVTVASPARVAAIVREILDAAEAPPRLALDDASERTSSRAGDVLLARDADTSVAVVRPVDAGVVDGDAERLDLAGGDRPRGASALRDRPDRSVARCRAHVRPVDRRRVERDRRWAGLVDARPVGVPPVEAVPRLRTADASDQ
jgi:hypothetical protein